MNATPSININPVNTTQPAASGKPQDAAADVPFKQVLSSEMAQKRGEHASKKDSDINAGSTDSGATPATQATEAESPVNGATDAQTDAIPVMPETLLALALPPDMQKSAPVSKIIPSADQALPLDADATPSGRKSRTAQFQAGQFSGETADAQSPDAVPSGKAKLQASAQAAAAAAATAAANAQATTPAAAFAGQLAAARQADALKTRELPTDFMNHAAMRPATQASFNLPSADPLASNQLAPPVGTSAWSQALGEKVVWMAAGAQQTASLTLNPPNMGPLQIVLNITNDQATASFFSAQPEVRQALEAAFPKLRDMMNEAGIQLGQATVSADTPRQNDTPDRQAQRVAAPFSVTDDGVTIGQTAPHAAIQHSGRGLIDTFA